MLNLDFTVAVTQNFVSPANLEAAVQWQALGAGEIEDGASCSRRALPCSCMWRLARSREGVLGGGLICVA